jgi:hypothetical protein
MPNLVIPKPEEMAPGHALIAGLALAKLPPLEIEALEPAKPKGPPKPKPVPHVPESKTWTEKGMPLQLKEATTSPALYAGIHSAFDHFNKALFANTPLPEVIFTLQRKPRCHGYFKGSEFAAKQSNDALPDLSEIALHPETLKREPMEVLSTLVHEMVHLWQWAYGQPGKKGYHNPQWAQRMSALGLKPKALGKNGEPNGKMTGYKVTHEIIDGGKFKAAAIELLGNGWTLSHYAKQEIKPEGKPSKGGTRVKYCCTVCENTMWGRRGQIIKCKGAGSDTHSASSAMLYKGMFADFTTNYLSVTSNCIKQGPHWDAFYADMMQWQKSKKPMYHADSDEIVSYEPEVCTACGETANYCSCEEGFQS